MNEKKLKPTIKILTLLWLQMSFLNKTKLIKFISLVTLQKPHSKKKKTITETNILKIKVFTGTIHSTVAIL